MAERLKFPHLVPIVSNGIDRKIAECMARDVEGANVEAVDDTTRGYGKAIRFGTHVDLAVFNIARYDRENSEDYRLFEHDGKGLDGKIQRALRDAIATIAAAQYIAITNHRAKRSK